MRFIHWVRSIIRGYFLAGLLVIHPHLGVAVEAVDPERVQLLERDHGRVSVPRFEKSQRTSESGVLERRVQLDGALERVEGHVAAIADVLGDWREEIIVLAGNELSIYQNPAPNSRPDQPRLWTNRNYRRLKKCHNYYSP